MAFNDLIYFDSTGFHYADYPTLLARITSDFQSIYGIDAYIDPDSQDGQNLAIRATSIYDVCQIVSAAFTQFSPTFAQGLWLSSTVKTNGIRRLTATNSTVDLTIVGTAGTVITNGKAEDTNGAKWNLPATVTIPLGGSIVVTATSETAGAITASSATIAKIATPTLGWQTVNNVSAATAGRNMETDAELRTRQRVSTAMPSLSVLEGIKGGIANTTGVTRSKVYENDSNVTDADGIPAHSISAVVEGGTTQAIADSIALRKTPGTRTYGTTSATTYDRYGVPNTINFYRPTNVTIKVEVTISALSGYLTAYSDSIKQALVDYIATLGIGDDVYLTKLYVPANLSGTAAGLTFDISLLRIAKNAGAFGTSNIVLAFNEVAISLTTDITVIVV